MLERQASLKGSREWRGELKELACKRTSSNVLKDDSEVRSLTKSLRLDIYLTYPTN